MKRILSLVLIGSIMLVAGCAAIRLEAPALDKPVSMSRKADTEKAHRTVRHFWEEKRAVWLLYGAIPIYVPEVDEIVAKESSGHDAVTNLAITTEFDIVDLLIIAITGGGIVHTRSVVVEGDVVELSEQAPE